MQHLPEAVSSETIQRAIRSKLLLRHGLASHFVRLPLHVEMRLRRQHGRNWELAVPECADAAELEAAAVEVARHYNLRAK
jgi:hypothetical protein